MLQYATESISHKNHVLQISILCQNVQVTYVQVCIFSIYTLIFAEDVTEDAGVLVGRVNG